MILSMMVAKYDKHVSAMNLRCLSVTVLSKFQHHFLHIAQQLQFFMHIRLFLLKLLSVQFQLILYLQVLRRSIRATLISLASSSIHCIRGLLPPSYSETDLFEEEFLVSLEQNNPICNHPISNHPEMHCITYTISRHFGLEEDL